MRFHRTTLASIIAILSAAPVFAWETSTLPLGLFDNGRGSAEAVKAALPDEIVDGVTLRVSWQMLQPTKSGFNFKPIVEHAAAAKAAGKSWNLVVTGEVPAWITASLKSFNKFPDANGSLVNKPRPQDLVALHTLKLSLALGSAFDGNPELGYVQVPHFTSASDRPVLDDEKAVVDIKAYYAAMTQIVSQFQAAFPHKPVVIAISPERRETRWASAAAETDIAESERMLEKLCNSNTQKYAVATKVFLSKNTDEYGYIRYYDDPLNVINNGYDCDIVAEIDNTLPAADLSANTITGNDLYRLASQIKTVELNRAQAGKIASESLLQYNAFDKMISKFDSDYSYISGRGPQITKTPLVKTSLDPMITNVAKNEIRISTYGKLAPQDRLFYTGSDNVKLEAKRVNDNLYSAPVTLKEGENEYLLEISAYGDYVSRAIVNPVLDTTAPKVAIDKVLFNANSPMTKIVTKDRLYENVGGVDRFVKVQVSTDGGKVWATAIPATSSYEMTIRTWTAKTRNPAMLRYRFIDAVGNTSAPVTPAVVETVAAGVLPLK